GVRRQEPAAAGGPRFPAAEEGGEAVAEGAGPGGPPGPLARRREGEGRGDAPGELGRGERGGAQGAQGQAEESAADAPRPGSPAGDVPGGAGSGRRDVGAAADRRGGPAHPEVGQRVGRGGGAAPAAAPAAVRGAALTARPLTVAAPTAPTGPAPPGPRRPTA